MFTIDAHLDLSMNALEWNRDLTKTVAEINQREIGLSDKPGRGKATVSLPELRKGNIGLVVATQIARCVAPVTLYRVGIHQNRHGPRHRDSWPGTKRWKILER